MPDRFDRFTPRARRVLKLAADEAERLRHGEIGTEHLLLGLLREGRGLGALAVRELGIDADDDRRRVEIRLRPGDVAPNASVGLSPSAKHAIEMAVAEANRFHYSYLGTEHLLLGLLSAGEGLAYVTLDSLGVSLDRARRQVIKLINERPADPERVTRAGVFGMLRGARATRAEAPIRQSRPVGSTILQECRRCGGAREGGWRFCAFCGEPSARCGRCDAPVPQVAGVRFCPQCGGAVESDEPA